MADIDPLAVAPNGLIIPDNFGLSDDWQAINAAIQYVMDVAEAGGPQLKIRLPKPVYNCDRTIYIGDPENRSRNRSPIALLGSWAYQRPGTRINFPADVVGIDCSPFCFGAELSGLRLSSALGTNDAGAHGIRIRTEQVTVKDCFVHNFSGDLVHIQSGWDEEFSLNASSNGWILDNVRLQNSNRWGLHVDGANSTLGSASNLDIRTTGAGGIWDTPYYPNVYRNIQCSGCGIGETVSGSKGGAVKGSDGRGYYVRPNKDDLASTTDPTSPGSSAVWLLVEEIADPRWPLWQSGERYACGLVIYSAQSRFESVYTEAGYTLSALLEGTAYAVNSPTLPLVNADGFRSPHIIAEDGAITVNGFTVVERMQLRDSAGVVRPELAGKKFLHAVGGHPEKGLVSRTTDQDTGDSFGVTYNRASRDFSFDAGDETQPLLTLCGLNCSHSWGRSSPMAYVVNVPTHLLVGSGAGAFMLRGYTGAFPPKDYQGQDYHFRWGDFLIRMDGGRNETAFKVCVGAGVGSEAKFASFVAAPVNYVLNEVSTPPAGNLNLTAADISGGANKVYLNLTADLSADATATLPTVEALTQHLGDKFYRGQTYLLQIANLSAGEFSLTIAANTGWHLDGSMAIGHSAPREFIVTLTSATTALLQATSAAP